MPNSSFDFQEFCLVLAISSPMSSTVRSLVNPEIIWCTVFIYSTIFTEGLCANTVPGAACWAYISKQNAQAACFQEMCVLEKVARQLNCKEFQMLGGK